MLSSIRRVFLVVLFATIAGAGSPAWADHGGHGGGHGGGGWSGHGGGGGWSGHGGGWSGGHGNVNFGHFGGHSSFNNHWGGVHFNSGFRFGGWPYYSYYRPYAYRSFAYPYFYGYGGYPSSYYGYPSYYYSYPSDYYVNGNDYYYGDAPLPQEYVVSRPVVDVARMEVRLPDPQATIWVQGQEMTSAGTLRRFRSPELDPSRQFTYNVKAEWNDNGKLVSDERKVKVQANSLAVVDFTQPVQAVAVARAPALPALPPPQQNP